MNTPVYNFDADLDRMLASRDWSKWNHTALRSVSGAAAGYVPFDGPETPLVTAATRAKALKLLEAYLVANHHYNLLPNLFLTQYGREFKRMRRVAYRILQFAKKNPQAAIPLQTLAGWMALEGIT